MKITKKRLSTKEDLIKFAKEDKFNETAIKYLIPIDFFKNEDGEDDADTEAIEYRGHLLPVYVRLIEKKDVKYLIVNCTEDIGIVKGFPITSTNRDLDTFFSIELEIDLNDSMTILDGLQDIITRGI